MDGELGSKCLGRRPDSSSYTLCDLGQDTESFPETFPHLQIRDVETELLGQFHDIIMQIFFIGCSLFYKQKG